MRTHARRGLATTALVALACLVACSRAPTTSQRTFTALRVTRTSAFPRNGIPPFDATTDNAASVRQFYQTLLALPAPPSGPINCPADFGVAYQLTFYAGTVATARATVDAGGCGLVTVGGSTHWWIQSPSFWQEFADTLGVPVADLYPVVPQPTGTGGTTTAP